MAGIITSLLAGLSACTLNQAPSLELASRDLRLGDVVNLDCAAPTARAHLGALVIARLPDRAGPTRLTRTALAQLVRRRAPAFSHIAAGEGEIVLRVRPAPSSAAPRACFRAADAIGEGEPVSPDRLAPAACEAASARGALRYDQIHRVTRAARAIESGEYLGAVAASTLAADQGQVLTLVVRAGAVEIRRPVHALQPARAGDALFVRDEDGQVFVTSAGAARP